MRRRIARPIRRVQPRVVAQSIVGSEGSSDPIGRRIVDQMPQFEKRRIHLRFRLLGIAPVDEQRRFVFQYDRDPRRSAEARQPLQPLGVSRNELVLMLVGPRNDETLQAGVFQFSAQFGEAPVLLSRAFRRRKRLKSTLKQGRPPISAAFRPRRSSIAPRVNPCGPRELWPRNSSRASIEIGSHAD